MSHHIVIPVSSDGNRGDQALVWETVRLAHDSGYRGQWYILGTKEQNKQTEELGVRAISPLIRHPKRNSKNNDNRRYDARIRLQWGFRALFDLVGSLLLLSAPTRFVTEPFLDDGRKRSLQLLRGAGAVFVKGGGFIHSEGKLTDSYTVYYQVFHILLAHSLKIPVYVMPNSLGPFRGLGVERMVRAALSPCRLVSVRESISLRMLQDIGIDPMYSPDLGFCLEGDGGAVECVRTLRRNHDGRQLVALTVRPYRYPGCENPLAKSQDFADEIAAFASQLYLDGYFPVLVEQVISSSMNESDMVAISEATRKLKLGEFAIIANPDFTCRDLRAIYGEFDYVVGTRFHSAIFAMAAHVPTIAISYGGNKGQGIMQDMQLADFAIPIEDVTCARLTELFGRLVTEKEEVLSRIERYSVKTVQERRRLVEALTLP